jgi:hypothetical protein
VAVAVVWLSWDGRVAVCASDDIADLAMRPFLHGKTLSW